MKVEKPPLTKSPKDEFIDVVTEINKAKGLDELSSKLIGILFIEPEEIPLEELAQRTGYSLSAVSTSMKFLEKVELVSRIKKPKSKKVYFYMKKDLIGNFVDLMAKKSNQVIQLIKNRLPLIIEKYKLEKSETAKKELAILENYYRQMLVTEKIMVKLIQMLEEAKCES